MLKTAGSIFLSLMSLQAFAEDYILKGDYYVRSSMDFLSTNNKIGVLQEGSTFRVINRYPRPNGAEALEIAVTSMSPKGSIGPSPSGRIFIYKPAKTNDFVYNSDDRVEAGVPKLNAKCENCNDAPVETSTTSLTRISDTVIEMQNTAPKAKAQPSDKLKIEIKVGAPAQGSLDRQIRNYSESPEVSRMIDWAMKNKSAASKGKCYRKVKEALATQCGPPHKGLQCRNIFAPEGGKKGPGHNLTKFVSTELADAYALSAQTRLKQQGFVNLLEIEPYKSEMRLPSQAPKGAVLVYSSGIPCQIAHKVKVPDCGHVEIKTGNAGEDGYVSDYYSKDAINQTPRARKYKLVGIMIKPKDK